MNIEDLKKLGISEDAAKKILAMHEEAISAEKKKLSDKEAELEMAAEKIRELTEGNADTESLRNELAAANKKYNEDTSAMKLENAIALALVDCGAIDRDIVSSLIDRSALKLENGRLMGLDEQLEKFRTEKAFLFGEEPSRTMDIGLKHGAPTSGDCFGFKFTGIWCEKK